MGGDSMCRRISAGGLHSQRLARADVNALALRSCEFTLPFSKMYCRKIPTSSELVAIYGNNREALIRLGEMAHLGLRARLLDAGTRAPLRADVRMIDPADIWPPQVSVPSNIPVDRIFGQKNV